MDKILADEETKDSRELLLRKIAENTMDEAGKF